MKLLSSSALVLLLLLVIPKAGYSCKCKSGYDYDKTLKIEKEVSDLIIIGKVVSISQEENYALVTISETFKGSVIKNSIIKIFYNESCTPYFNEKGDWLIYASLDEEQYHLNSCGLTRSFKNPDKNRYFRTPPPPPPSLSEKRPKKYDRKKIDKQFRKKALILLKKEITLLRNSI